MRKFNIGFEVELLSPYSKGWTQRKLARYIKETLGDGYDFTIVEDTSLNMRGFRRHLECMEIVTPPYDSNKAIKLLEQNQDKIYWPLLSENSEALHLLEQNQDKIVWWHLSKNPAIFVYDYVKIKEYMETSGIKDELIAAYYSPKNVGKFINRGDLEDGFECRWGL